MKMEKISVRTIMIQKEETLLKGQWNEMIEMKEKGE